MRPMGREKGLKRWFVRIVLSGAQNAWKMFHDLSVQITTSSADVDSILGGGIRCREVTEIGGTPGIGKTQFGIQLAINVQIPNELGGLGGKAIYVDTEGSFMVERALQIAEGCVEDMQKDNRFQRRDFQAVNNKLIDPKDFLANIYHFRICSYTEKIAMINHLDKWISEHKDVKLVVIDSVTFYFRQDFEDMALRTRILGDLALKLMKLAQKYNLAWFTLIRSHAEVVVDDELVFPIFRKHCKRRPAVDAAMGRLNLENLQHWLADAKARGQFVIRSGQDTEVLWNDARQLKPGPVYKHSFCSMVAFGHLSGYCPPPRCCCLG